MDCAALSRHTSGASPLFNRFTHSSMGREDSMGRTSRQVLSGIAVISMLFTAAAAFAQTGASGIAGQVKDTSGAVLPGVTVEAASPALIEKVRTVVSDDQGQYRFADLRPGLYVVTF